MYKKIKSVLILVIFISFITFIIYYYLSEKNIVFTNKSRSSFNKSSILFKKNLPLLKNDTNNIITHIDELENFNNNRKLRFWEKLIFNSND
jgi:hypothetical protein